MPPLPPPPEPPPAARPAALASVPRGRRLALPLLGVSALLLVASLLRPLRQDEGWLLELAGRPVDVAGQAAALATQALRRCAPVQRWPAHSPRWQQVQQVLAAYSPPASARAHPVQLLGLEGDVDGAWLLAEVRWDDQALDAAIVPLRWRGGVPQVQAEGVWSGQTGPWWPATMIRRYLHQRLPDMPAALADCLDPTISR